MTMAHHVRVEGYAIVSADGMLADGKANIEPPPSADNGKPDYQSRLDTFSKQMRARQFWQRAD